LDYTGSAFEFIMGFIRSRWADISSQRTINGTIVDSFVRTDATGPMWSLKCCCGRYFLSPHSKIAPALHSSAPVYCGQCRIASENSETLSQIRAKEKAAERQAEQEAEAKREMAAQRAAKELADRKYLESFRADHHRYAMQQIKQSVPVEQIMSLGKFANLRDDIRERIMQAVATAERREHFGIT
jgi:hypothetical protein